MKRAISVLFLALSLVLLTAANQYNQTTSVYQRGETFVVYKFNFDFSSDSTDDFYSKAIFIGDLNDNDGYVEVTLSNETGTEDVNVFYEYSYDGTTWTAASADDELDSLGSGTQQDTLGIIDGVDDLMFHQYPLMRVHASGETGNASGIDFTMYLHLNINPIYDANVPKIGGVRRY